MKWKELPADPSPPIRPASGGYGDKGSLIKLTTNHFPVKIGNPKLILYHYDVTIKDKLGNESLPKKLKMIIFEKMKTTFPKVFEKHHLGFDSMKNAYSPSLIPQLKKPSTYQVEIAQDGCRKNEFNVTMNKVSQARLKDLLDAMKYTPGGTKAVPTTITQMIEVMFRHYRAVKYEQISGRNFFSLNGDFAQPNYIGGGKEGITGFFGSLRPAAWKDGSLLLNLDLAHTAFYKEQSVIEFLKDCCNLSERDFTQTFNDRVLKQATSNLKGLKVRVTHAPIKRTYKVLKVMPLGAADLSFKLDDDKGTSKKVSVRDYIKKQYNFNLQYPRLNCLHVGNPDKNVYLPIEVCNINKGQRVTKKLTDKETSIFIRGTAIPPYERLQKIKATASKNCFNEDPMLKALAFTISDVPLQITGRVLPPPTLTMKQQRFDPRQGVWDIRDKNFHVGAELKTWTVINYDPYKTPLNLVKDFVKSLVEMGNRKGMRISQPCDIYDAKGEPNPSKDFKYYKNEFPDIQLIMCVLPFGKHYGSIKTAGDIESKIISQCVTGVNVGKAQPQTIGNILLKINAKMEGVNNIVGTKASDLVHFKEPFLIMGADVNHPPAGGDKSIPSLAAVVGSYDMHATKYAVEVRAQYHRAEMIQDLTEITMNLLKMFYKTNKVKPRRIIMYRDGVSESQFLEVLSKEMNKMRDACKKLSPDGSYTPGITFICVQKRHHTRLFCDERDGVGKSKNVPPGTIVDKDITHPSEMDFYLCSHQGIQGTSKPTHYHLLWDDNDLPMNELQALTYRLCHVYSRCSRAVSIPTPVYYAHLAAFRAKVYVSEMIGGSDTTSIASGGSGEIPSMDEIKRQTRVAIDQEFGRRLYYV